MKVIQCEMCGSHDLIKKDGVFVCENCGTKYTLEEAKKLMIDGVVSVSIDTSKKEQDLLKIIEAADEANNYQEVYDSATKLVEMNPNIWQGWYYKFIGAGYLSEHNLDRFEESLTYFDKAAEVCSEEEYESVKERFLNEVVIMMEYLHGMHCINFQTDIDGDTAYNMSSFMDDAFSFIDFLVEDFGYSYCDAYELKTKMCHKFFKTLQQAKVNSDSQFGNTKVQKTNEKWEVWIQEQLLIEGNAEDLINSDIRPQDFQPFFNFMTRVVTDRIDSASYEYISGQGYVESLVLSDGAIRESKKSLKEVLNKKEEILAAANERETKYHLAKNEKYWEEHKDEKEKLLNKKDSLEDNLKDIDAKIDNIDNAVAEAKAKFKKVLPEEERVIATERLIELTKCDLKKHSLFDFKGKAPTKEKIKKLKTQLANESSVASTTRKKYDSSIKREIAQLIKEKMDLLSEKETTLKKINEIKETLTKNR